MRSGVPEAATTTVPGASNVQRPKPFVALHARGPRQAGSSAATRRRRAGSVHYPRPPPARAAHRRRWRGRRSRCDAPDPNEERPCDRTPSTRRCVHVPPR
ncbi:MAG: hypothetical protein O9972_25725 [Burkholderiales bacterium]|nr:hypothetical protein [Burkholderiales bacterium]